MKIREIISEGLLSEGNLDNSGLISILLYLKERADDDANSAELRTNSVIQLVRNSGEQMFDYQMLAAAFEQDPAVKNLIKSFNKETITLKSEYDNAEDELAADQAPEMSPEETVQNMAQKATAKRT